MPPIASVRRLAGPLIGLGDGPHPLTHTLGTKAPRGIEQCPKRRCAAPFIFGLEGGGSPLMVGHHVVVSSVPMASLSDSFLDAIERLIGEIYAAIARPILPVNWTDSGYAW